MSINNGNRYIIDTDGIPHEFERDIDKLLYKYSNLRWSLYHRYSGALSNEAEREELKEYIDEQFIKLVKEYNIHSKVDFPGYIKAKLTLRVRNSFVKKTNRYKSHELISKQEDTVESLAESFSTDFEDSDVINYVFDGIEFTELQSILLKELLTNKEQQEDSAIISQIAKDLMLSHQEVAKELTELKDFIRYKISAYHKYNKKPELNTNRINTENHVWE